MMMPTGMGPYMIPPQKEHRHFQSPIGIASRQSASEPHRAEIPPRREPPRAGARRWGAAGAPNVSGSERVRFESAPEAAAPGDGTAGIRALVGANSSVAASRGSYRASRRFRPG